MAAEPRFGKRENGMCIKWLRVIGLLSVAVLLTGPARADIDLRVESRPNTDPIEAFVRVTDGSGSVTGLTAADFAVTLDGAALTTFTLGLPPDQDPTQKSSIAFVLGARVATSLVTDFINQMAVGNYAAIIRFKPRLDEPVVDTVVQPFTPIDGGTGILIDFLATQYRSSFRPYDPLFHGMILAIDQFATSLPNGPKAIVLISGGDDRYTTETLSDVVAYANRSSIPIFTIGVGDMAANPAAAALMSSLAADTGGNYFDASDQAKIAEAYVTISALLRHSYRLTIPQATVTDCNPHMLAVMSQGQTASGPVTRCDTTPDEFNFIYQDVIPGAVVVSNTVTITGIESPAEITVTGGEYSIGCSARFTSASGFVLPDDEVCVRHTASASNSTLTSTLLMVGGVSSWFNSLSSVAPPPLPPPPPPVGGDGGSGDGGGGATGVIELLLALGALFARRRRRL